MDFHLSYHWLEEFVNVRLSPAELAERLSLHAVSVERMRRMDDGLEGVVLGRILSIAKHPNADKLSVATVDIGRRKLQIIFGQMVIVHVGDKIPVAVAPTTLPSGVEIIAKELRGVRSEGMFCLDQELGLAPENEPPKFRYVESPAKVGEPIARVLGLDDVVFAIEVPTNRPDLMSVMGLAREVAAITGARVGVPRSGDLQVATSRRVGAANPRRSDGGLKAAATALRVQVEDAKRCPLYSATLVSGITVAPSPWWMQRRLLAGGIRPINNVVDVANYVLLEMGQPLHAFDAERLRRDFKSLLPRRMRLRRKISNNRIDINIRNAKAGERIVALDGETYALTPDHLVIADCEKPIAIAGVIGGSESAVGPQTQQVVLEAATFDAAAVRRAWRSLDIHTESAILYEKGVQPESVAVARDRALVLLAEVAGGQVVGKPVIAGRVPKAPRPIAFDVTAAQDAIGVAIAAVTAKKTLTALGCHISGSGARLRVTPPWWRRGDLEAAHDLIEEIARLYGYHTLPSVVPSGTLPIAAMLQKRKKKHSNILENVRMFTARTAFDWEHRCREVLADIGATEVLPFTLTSRENVERCGFTTEQCVALENPLSEDLALLRPSLLVTLLPIIVQNQGEVPSAVVFEMGNVYVPHSGVISPLPPGRGRSRGGGVRATISRAISSAVQSHPLSLPLLSSQRLSEPRQGGGGEPGLLPREELRLTLAAYGRLMAGGHMEKVKGMIEHLFAMLGVRDAVFRQSAQCTVPPGNCLWHPGRTMDVVIGDALVGVIGEVHPEVVGRFGIEQRVAVADLDWAALLPHVGAYAAPQPPPAYPAVKRDLAIVLDRATPYADVAALLRDFDPLLESVELFDQYEGPGIPMGKKSLAFHLAYRATDRTLPSGDADALHARVLAALRERFGAVER